MPSSVRSFFKFILSPMLLQGKLKIPCKFVKEHRHELSECVRLFIPTGSSWCVGVERDTNKTIWLHDGLLKFMEENSIGEGYCLIFEYEGNSMFNVLILDSTATEINYICKRGSANTGEGSGDAANIERSIDCIGSLTEHQIQQISEEGATTLSLNKFLKDVTLEPVNNNYQSHVTRRKKQKLDGGIEMKGADDYERIHKTSDGYKENEKTYKCSSKNNPSKYKDSKELAEGRTHQAENMPSPSSFEVNLKPYNIYKYILHVPAKFAKLNMPRSTSYIKLLDGDDNEWKVQWIFHLNNYNLSRGWIHFVRDKKLMVGDVCVFERIRGREVKLKVKIYRSADRKNSITYENAARSNGTYASPSDIMKERTILAERSSLRNTFEVTLEQIHIENSILKIPSYFAPLLRSHSSRLIKLVDGDNNEWVVRYIYRPLIQALTQGWIYFVQDKKLTVGDTCTFERVCDCGDEEIKLKVSISKSVK